MKVSDAVNKDVITHAENGCVGEIDFAVLRLERNGNQNLIIRGWIENKSDPITILQIGIPGCRLSFARWIDRFDLEHMDTENFFSYGFQAALSKNDLIAEINTISYIATLKSGLSKVGTLQLPEVRIQKISRNEIFDEEDYEEDYKLEKSSTKNNTKRSNHNDQQDLCKSEHAFREYHLKHWHDRLTGFLNTTTHYELPHIDSPKVSIIIPVHNKAELTYACLSSIIASGSTDYELIIVDNDSSDRTKELLRRFKGIKVIHSEINLHYLKGINHGANYASGTYLLFLNNDTILDPVAISHALKTCTSNQDIGAVGGRLISFDGKLQEAGSMILENGSSYAYGIGEDPWNYSYLFEREVDYCSGSFLMTPKDVFVAHGGFDERYQPAYYEEVDYCIRLKNSGLKVIYQPRSIIFHLEHGSASREESIAQQTKNRDIFCKIQSNFIAQCPSLHDSILKFGRSVTDKRKRVLYVDDRIPFLEAGAGFPRTNKLIQHLIGNNADVVFMPIKSSPASFNDIYDTIPQTVEIVPYEDEESFLNHIKLRFNFYDYIIISRPHNLEIWNRIKRKLNLQSLRSKLIYDAESIFSDREINLLQTSGELYLDEKEKEFVVSQELELAKDFDHITVVCERDLEVVKRHGYRSASILSYAVDNGFSERSFHERKDLLFIGPLLQQNCPNVDGIQWFIEEVFPRIKMKLGQNINLNIIGIKNAHAVPLTHNVNHLGPVTSVAPFYDIHKLVIAPIRITAGISIKTIEAAAHGVPIITTRKIAELMNWENKDCKFYSDDPEEYAEIISELYSNIHSWNLVKKWQNQRVLNEFSVENFKNDIKNLLLL